MFRGLLKWSTTLSLYAMVSSEVYVISQLMSRPLNRFQVHALFGHFIERKHLPQLGDDLNNLLDRIVNLIIGIETAQAEADRRVSEFRPDAKCAQHIRG